jgi:hypothetical protein
MMNVRKTILCVTVVMLCTVVIAKYTVLASENIEIRITSPVEGAKVPERPLIEGTVSGSKADVWVIIHPMEISTYFVQPSVTVKETGKWKVKVYVGKGNQGKGQQFEIMAIANPKSNLKEGDQLSKWPDSGAKSQVIEVTRE